MDEKDERIQTLQTLLAQAREREESFTTRSFKDQATIADLQSRIAQVDGRLTEAHRDLTRVGAELEARTLESDRTRAAAAELRADLDALAGHAAEALARAQASEAGRGDDARRVVDLSEERATNQPGAGWHSA
jgi:chromosome segregation ATPase